MKRFSKLASMVATFAVLPILAFTALPAFAMNSGQIDGGNIYTIENKTQNIAYANPASANACDLLKYSARIYNPGPSFISNVMVNATLPSTAVTSYTSTITTNSSNAFPTTTTATAALNLSSSQDLTYINGSTKLLDINGNLIENLPDTITQTSGVNIGQVGASVTEFVQFEVQVGGCAPAPTPTYTCNSLNITQSGNTVTANASLSTTNGATVSSVSYNFGEGTTQQVSPTANAILTYSPVTTNTTYTITATPTYTVNGTNVTPAVNTNCIKTVSIVAVPTTPTTPATPVAKPTALVNTGPGNVIALFGATTIVGAIAHRLLKNRLFAQNNR